uniref:Uncharacterized protein n=1 Tax=Anguilla anguilla TaxID=7936 RepID=A0A0E9PXN3_ANGAN
MLPAMSLSRVENVSGRSKINK